MSKRKNKKNLLIIIILAIIILIVIGIIMYKKYQEKYNYTLDKISEENIVYYLLETDNKYGVIDKNGNVIIEPQYVSLSIPNPTKDVFICTNSSQENATYKAVNSDNSQILTQFSDVESIQIKEITSLIPYEKTVLKYKEGNYYGLIDFSGNKITPAIYEEIKSIDYKEGCLQVKTGGKYGVINIKGTELIKPEYDNITADGYYDKEEKYSDAGFIIRQKTDEGYRFGYANSKGKIILEPIYNEVNRITEIENAKDVYLIPSSNGKYGLVKNGKQILENEYDDISYDKTNNILLIQKGDAKGICSIDGKNIIPIDYDAITIGGSYISAKKENSTIIFDTNGNKIDTDITSYNKVSENYAIIIDKDNNYNIVDKNGNKLLTENYAYIEYYTNDYFLVTKDNKTGIINSSGNIVVPLQYSTIQKIKNTNILQATESTEKRIDLINENVQIATGVKNSSISIKTNYIKIYSNTDVKYFTLSGNETTYKELYPNNKIYAKKQNEKWGFVDANGNTVISFKYDMVTEQNGNVAGIKLNGKWGVINTDNDIVTEPKYNISWNDVTFLGKYYAISDIVGVPIYCGDENL